MDAEPIPPPKNLLSLDVDCLVEIFSSLTLKDLAIVSRTCKRLNKIVGNVLQTNYSGLPIQVVPNEILTMNYEHTVRLTGLEKSIQNITFSFESHDQEGLGLLAARYIGPKCNKLIKRMQFFSCYLNRPMISCIEDLLKNIETLVIHKSAVHPDIYDSLPTICTNVKRLCISEVEFHNVNKGENQWLLRHYPQLEHLEWVPPRGREHEVLELPTFFENNPGVRCFSTQFACLLNSHLLLESNHMELDDLIVTSYSGYMETVFGLTRGSHHVRVLTPWQLDQCVLLNKLHDQGKYRRLHIGASDLDQSTLDAFIALKSLESLHFLSSIRLDLSHLTNLKDLWLQKMENLTDINVHATKLVNLQRIQVFDASTNEILPFISKSKLLTKLKIGRLPTESYLNLKGLNEFRKKLIGALKLTIYVPESVFIATRCEENETNFDCIEMRQAESIWWDNYLSYHDQINLLLSENV